MKTLRLILTTMLLLTCNMMYAFEVDGIYYAIVNTLDKTVKVVHYAQNSSNSTVYFGDIVIPSSIVYNDINYKVVGIDNGAFNYCTSLTSVELPTGLTSIGRDAFRDCSTLATIELPASVTSIGDYAFYGCSNLTSIELPAGITNIGKSTFYRCSSLTSIELPEGVTSIGSEAFSDCSNLTSIELPAGVTSIGSSAFYYCSSLTSIQLPTGLTSIGSSTFYGCSNLDRIYLSSETPFTYNSSAYISDKERAIIVPESAVENYKKAEGWSDIAKYITGAERMTKSIEVTASNTGSAVRTAITDALVEDVVDLTIKGTINSYDIIVLNQKMPILQNLDLSKATIVACDYPYYSSCCTKDNTLGDRMFYDKSSLRKIILPLNLVGTIGSYAFNGCLQLKNITIPENITEIGSWAFGGCSKLEFIQLRSNTMG